MADETCAVEHIVDETTYVCDLPLKHVGPTHIDRPQGYHWFDLSLPSPTGKPASSS